MSHIPFWLQYFVLVAIFDVVLCRPCQPSEGTECYHLDKQLNCPGVAEVWSGSVTPTICVSSTSHVSVKALEPFPQLSLDILTSIFSLVTSQQNYCYVATLPNLCTLGQQVIIYCLTPLLFMLVILLSPLLFSIASSYTIIWTCYCISHLIVSLGLYYAYLCLLLSSINSILCLSVLAKQRLLWNPTTSALIFEPLWHSLTCSHLLSDSKCASLSFESTTQWGCHLSGNIRLYFFSKQQAPAVMLGATGCGSSLKNS